MFFDENAFKFWLNATDDKAWSSEEKKTEKAAHKNKTPRPKHRTTIEFSVENWEWLSQIMFKTNFSRNQIINDLVREARKSMQSKNRSK